MCGSLNDEEKFIRVVCPNQSLHLGQSTVRQMISAFHESGSWLYVVEDLTKPRSRLHKPDIKMA